jgi:hypothetical protein
MTKTTIVVYGISGFRTIDEIKEYFSHYGQINYMNMTYYYGKLTYNIQYTLIEHARNAIDAEDGNNWDSDKLSVYHGRSSQDIFDVQNNMLNNGMETLGCRCYDDEDWDS